MFVFRIIKMTIIAVIALLMLLLAMANRHDVRLFLDPFRPSETGAAYLEVNLAMIVFAAFILGLVFGSVVMWFMQSDHRREARRLSRQLPS
ncbi:MAG: LapA family protein [Alphaproteobacteria bacterium TMED150]|nr:DUF1049 domain-containing protein [Paracoccaceae bacterium]RPH13472.1 MAG: LapA family protein [Alphaproteobacteria bacterium TMED150]